MLLIALIARLYNMRHQIIIITFFLSLATIGFSQYSELGVFGGTSYYIGELNPSIQVVNEVNPSVGLFYRRNTNTRYALRFGLNYAKLSASDSKLNSALSNYRQMSFQSELYEGYGILEFNFLPYEIGNRRTAPYSPYVFIGLAVFMVNPEIESNSGSTVNSTGTAIAPSVPFGVGIKFSLNNSWGMGLEWGMRKTFMDEIDGLTSTDSGGYQLSNSQNKDWYSLLGLTLNYKILTKDRRCPQVIN